VPYNQRDVVDVAEIVTRFERIYRADPERALVVLPALRKTITASDIWRQHQDFIAELTRLQLRDGDLLVCSIGNRPELLPLLLACRALDVAVMALDTGATATEIQSLCQRFGARAVLTSAAAFGGPDRLRQGFGAPPQLRAKAEGPPLRQPPTGVAAGLMLARTEVEPKSYQRVAMLKVTSGSTGLPRATRTTEAQLVIDSTQIVTTMGIGPDDTQMAVIPLAHAYGLSVIVVPLLLQGTAMILRDSFIPPDLSADARAFGARCLAGVPFMFDHLIAHPPADGWPPTLTKLISAGARLSPATVLGFHERFGLKVHTFYGTTESGGISYDESDEPENATTVGRPLSGVSLTLVPMDGLPDGFGRVHVQSAGASDGYVGEDSADFANGGFLTGDYGSIGEDRRLTLAGRVSSFINVAGRKVQPDEVEAVLREMPAVRDVRVVAAADAQRGQQVVACVASTPGFPAPSLIEVRRFCSTRLAPHKIPRCVLVLESIPMTPRGKTDRAALDDLVRAHVDPRA
jgi:long-chain acyl-CoA synthetase